MRLYTAQIKQDGRILRDEVIPPMPLLGTPPEFISFKPPLTVHVRAYKTDREIVATGRAQMEIGLVCARCLETFSKKIDVEFTQVFDPGVEFIDLSNDIREAVFVDLPFKAVCSDACKGLCPSCGQNRNLRPCQCTAPAAPHLETLRNFPFK